MPKKSSMPMIRPVGGTSKVKPVRPEMHDKLGRPKTPGRISLYKR